jgi:diaminopimelate decarboxylase
VTDAAGTTESESGDGDENPPVRRLDDWQAADLRPLADEHGTPLYVLDTDRVRENYRRFRAALPDASVHYAVKANTSPTVLAVLEEEGASVEVASPGELRAVRRAGFDASRIHYTAVNPPADDLDRVVDYWESHPAVTVTVGARETLERLVDRGFDGRIAIRVNPDAGTGHHEKVVTGVDAQFGVPADSLQAVAEQARTACEFVGVHAHVGSGILDGDLAGYRQAIERVADLAVEVEPLEFLDVGGGFGVPYEPGEDPLDLDAVAATIRDATAAVDATVVVEPGRYLVADAGVLLTRVNTRKEPATTVVAGVDAGLTTLLRPAMFDAYHPIRNLAPDATDRSTESVTVGGPVCSSADTFCRDRELAAPRRGDLLAIGNAGAYGYELANRFHRRRLPAEVALGTDDGEPTVTRRRDRFADLEALEQ